MNDEQQSISQDKTIGEQPGKTDENPPMGGAGDLDDEIPF
jgi:hypothetical protein